MTTTPHKHAEVIKAWADGSIVQMNCGEEWQDLTVECPSFRKEFEYRVKPAEPERKYPETILTDDEMLDTMKPGQNPLKSMRDCVNAALRHAIDSGQVVTREDHESAVGDRKEYEMAVARAVDAWYCQTFSNKQANTESYLADIIKGIKP